LSLAIGREGQNARLAARLTGWRIDIKSDAALARAELDAWAGGPADLRDEAAVADTGEAAPPAGSEIDAGTSITVEAYAESEAAGAATVALADVGPTAATVTDSADAESEGRGDQPVDNAATGKNAAHQAATSEQA
jgi:hypothetical protein